MKKTVLIFGFISGAVATGLMLATIPFLNSPDFRKGDILGYTSIVLSALLVFFGILSYRESAGSGALTFGSGLAVGLLITLVFCACYVAAFEVTYFRLAPHYGEDFAACMVERARVSGASQQKIEETTRQAQNLKRMYDQPATNAALTFALTFPIGLIASVLSAAILRRKAASNEN